MRSKSRPISDWSKPLRNSRILALLLVLPILTAGCASQERIVKVPCPERPTPHIYTLEQQLAMDPVVLEHILENEEALLTYIERLEARANCEDR